jgi:hypothetical protein
MGRVMRCQAHTHAGLASANDNAEHENHSTIARTFFVRPAQADEVNSARDADHEDMQNMR